MQTTITSKHVGVTRPIEQYADKKVGKLARFFDRIQQIDVVIDKVRNGYTIEIITDVEHHDPFVATADHADLYACIDLGVDRAARQLKDHKSRLRDNKHVTPNSHTIPMAGAKRLGRRAVSGRKRTTRSGSSSRSRGTAA
jgi:putative sigma-54 modulation protein